MITLSKLTAHTNKMAPELDGTQRKRFQWLFGARFSVYSAQYGREQSAPHVTWLVLRIVFTDYIMYVYSGTSLIQSPTGLHKSDLNGEVTILHGANVILVVLGNTIWD